MNNEICVPDNVKWDIVPLIASVYSGFCSIYGNRKKSIVGERSGADPAATQQYARPTPEFSAMVVTVVKPYVGGKTPLLSWQP